MKKFIDNFFGFEFQDNHEIVSLKFVQGTMILRVVYLFLAYIIFYRYGAIYSQSLSPLPDKLWSVFWITDTNQFFVMNFVSLALLCGCFSTAIFVHNRYLRISVLILFIIYIGFTNSYGKINHGSHIFFAPLLILGLTSSSGETHENRVDFLKIFRGVQLLILVFYTFGGLYKLMNGLDQLFNDSMSMFNYQSLSTLIARRLMDTNSTSMLGDFLVNTPRIAYILYMGAFYLEICSIAIINKGSLHRFWGTALAGMHLSILLSMDVGFPQSAVIVFLIFGLSPFIETKNFRKSLYDLPIFGFIFKRLF